MYVTKII